MRDGTNGGRGGPPHRFCPNFSGVIPSSVSNATNLSYNMLIILGFLTENRKPKTENGIRVFRRNMHNCLGIIRDSI
jgi:hypothetical protein